MSISSMKHIGIYTRNFEQMVKFYKETLGLIELVNYTDCGMHLDHILKRTNAVANICKLITPMGKKNGTGDMIELIGVHNNSLSSEEKELFAPGLSHIAFEVDDIFSFYESIIRHGGQGICEPKIVKDSGNYMSFCRDIEGNYIELIQKG